PSFAAFCLLPAPPQQLDFLVAPDERRLPRAQGLEPAHLAAFAQYPPGALRLGKAGKLLQPEGFQIKQLAHLPTGPSCAPPRVRRPRGRPPSGKVRRLADDPALLRCALADQIADHGQPGSDAEPYTEIFPRR